MNRCVRCGSENIIEATIADSLLAEKNECAWYQMSTIGISPLFHVCLGCRHIEMLISEQEQQRLLKIQSEK